MDEGGQIGEDSPGESSEQEPWSQQQSQEGSQGQQPQGRQQYQQQPPPRHPAPRSQPFSSEQLSETLGMALVLGIILLFVGGILVSTAGFLDAEDPDNYNTKENINAVANLLSSIGLLAIGGVASWAFYQADDLTEKQKLFLMLLIVGAIIGFTIVLTNGPMGLF